MAGEDYTFVTGEKKTVTHLPGTTPDGSFGPLCNNSIVAIFAVSGCQVFCSKDKHADKYVKMRTLYPQGQNPPGIYRRRTHRHLLCDDNIVALRNRKR